MPSRWSVGGLMRVVLAIGLALGLLRSPLGPIVALAAGGVVGCGLAPWFACRGMRKLDRELSHAQGDAPPSSPQARHRASLVAQSYVLIWAGWFLAGVAVAAIGLLLHHVLRR
jgi:hypothetical protein